MLISQEKVAQFPWIYQECAEGWTKIQSQSERPTLEVHANFTRGRRHIVRPRPDVRIWLLQIQTRVHAASVAVCDQIIVPRPTFCEQLPCQVMWRS